MYEPFAFGRSLPGPFDRALERVTEELRKEGFGVLTQIDVAATLKAKLGVEFPAYRILGACNPQLAHQALQAEPQVGLLLPCNVVVRAEQHGVRIEFMNPDAALALIDKPAVREVSAQARERLRRVCDSL